MEITLKVALDAETMGALNALTAAIAGIGSGAAAATPATAEPKTDKPEPEGPIYWADSKDGQFGKVNKEAEFAKLKKKSDTVYKIPESKYQELQEAARKKVDEKKSADKAAAAEKDNSAGGDDEGEVPSLDDLIAVFSTYLPKDLDKDERAKRAAFVKPMLERFGVEKAGQIPEKYRALAINLVQRKMAGEDVDPKKAELAEVKEAASDDDGDLV